MPQVCTLTTYYTCSKKLATIFTKGLKLSGGLSIDLFICGVPWFCLGTENRTHFSDIFGLHDAWSCHRMVLGGWGGGVRIKFPAVERVMHSIPGPWIQLTVQQGSQERVGEGDRAAVFTRLYLEPNIMACQCIA